MFTDFSLRVCILCTDAAYSFLRKKSRMFSLSSNNAFLEFMFEGFPELIETQLDSKKVCIWYSVIRPFHFSLF